MPGSGRGPRGVACINGGGPRGGTRWTIIELLVHINTYDLYYMTHSISISILIN